MTSEIDHDIENVRNLARQLSDKYNVSFIGFFQNANRTFERMISAGIETTITPNGSFESFALNNITNSSDFQDLFSFLINPSSKTSSPKQFCSNASNSWISRSEDPFPKDIYKMVNINPHHRLDVKNYLYTCLEEFQQIPCKLLSKAWIKIVEPKKQAKYPYKSGDSSKPYWWPEDCIHREPDHLKKDERINLLINILRIFKHKKSELIYAASLIPGLRQGNITTDIGNHFGERKMSLLNDMFQLANAENDSNIKSLRVIKPGKKYSSVFYKKNNMKSLGTSSDYSRTHNETPKRKYGSKSSNNCETPLSMAVDPQTKLAPYPHPLNNTDNEFGYHDLTEYMITSRHDDIKNIDLQSSAGLASPFIPDSSTKVKYPINTHVTPPKYFNIGDKSNEVNIDTQFFNDNTTFNITKNIKTKPLTPINPFKIYNQQVSPPPTGTFSTPRNTNALGTLNQSTMNSLNQKLHYITNTSHLLESKLEGEKEIPVSRKIRTFKIVHDKLSRGGCDHDETDVEIE